MKIASVLCLLLALTLGMESSTARGAETNDVPRVGQLREFDRFTFEGNTSFSGWSLWFGLNSTFDFPELSHPLAPRDAFLASIESQLRLGYKHCGFPDARITARYDSQKDRVTVQVMEGARYQCGPVEVVGARKVPVQPIVKALSVTNAPTGPIRQSYQFLDNAPANRATEADAGDLTNQDFLWVAGQPAHFDDISLHYLAAVITNALTKHGFLMSRFNLNVEPDPRTQTATMRVKILDEGPQATVNGILVVGNQRNSRTAILNYLDVKPGMEFTSDLAVAINDRLYHSARFLTNSVSVGVPDSAGRVTLTINVVENDQCPPLDREFSPAEETMLKARDWLANVGDTSEDAVLTFLGYPADATAIQFILAPRQGLLVLENEAASGSNQLGHALIMSPSQIALYDPELQQKFVAPHSLEQFKTWLAVETTPPAENGNCANLTLGAGTENLEATPSAPPFAFSISLAPAAFVRLAHSTNSVIWLDRDQLVSSNADSILKLDARTGRFIAFTAITAEPHHMRLSLRFQPKVFVPALERVENDGASYENVYDTNSPLGSAVAFFGSELVQSKFVEPYLRTRLPAVTYGQLPAMLHKLGSGDFFAPFKSLEDFETPPDGPAGKFEIPEEPQPAAGGTVDAWLATAAQGIFQCGDEIFPKGSWPWTLERDLAFVSRHQVLVLLPDMAGILDSKETGPLGYLATASFLIWMNSPVAKPMAERGLERLSADDFKRDCQLFLDERTFCGRFAAGLAGTLRDLDDQELDALVAPMPPAHAEFIRACATRLRAAKPGQPLFETLAPVLNNYWEKSLKQEVADNLRRLANE